MSAIKKTIVLGASSVLALAGVGSSFAVASPSPEVSAPDAVENARQETYEKTDIVSTDVVSGKFAYTQSEVSSNDDLKAVAGASKYLCGARPAGDAGSLSAHDWVIEVRGAVDHPYVASFDELCETEEVQSLLLGCACAGNPADGKASANAEVTGVAVRTLIGIAGVQEEANTIVFTSADGYEVALPLQYVKTHYCPVVYDVNGAPLAETMGGSNQLWLGSTSANYFARDIVAITLEERQTPPPSPSSDEARAAYANLPNVGVSFGGDIQ